MRNTQVLLLHEDDNLPPEGDEDVGVLSFKPADELYAVVVTVLAKGLVPMSIR